MIGDKSAIAIIPARSGSKGLPGKNIRSLCGKPLIVWSIEKALKSNHLDKVVVSTDSETIAEIARQAGAEVPFLRPAELASDTATSIDVVKHALGYFAENGSRRFDYMALVEPTSPLREDDDIDRMLEKLHSLADNHDAIVSVGEVAEHPSIMKRLVGDRFEPYSPELRQASRRQDNERAYFPYGVAYILKTRTLFEEETFYPQRATWYQIKPYQTYEIDSLYDFLCVESIMRYQWGF